MISGKLGRWVRVLVMVCSLLCVSRVSRAACTMDGECPGDQICESGACTAPRAATAAAPSSGPSAAAAQPTVPGTLQPLPDKPKRLLLQPQLARDLAGLQLSLELL